VPLARLNDEKDKIYWVTANWKTTTTAKQKSAANQNTEAKKIMELVLHLTKKEDLETLFTPLPDNSTHELSIAMDKRREVMDRIVDAVMQFLTDHEKKTKTSSSRQSSASASTTGALYSRWKKLQYTTKDPNDNTENNIQPWPAAGMALNGSATAIGQGQQKEAARKRQRQDIE